EQDGTDTLGQWVEVFNRSGGEVDLQGLKLRIRKLDGTNDLRIPIRRSVTVAADGYVVLGEATDAEGSRPDYVDYGFLADFDQDWYAAGAVSIEGCGTDAPSIDVVTYNALPDSGTYSLGLAAPTADGNDDASNWCPDVSNSNA